MIVKVRYYEEVIQARINPQSLTKIEEIWKALDSTQIDEVTFKEIKSKIQTRIKKDIKVNLLIIDHIFK
jgi:hypothetical protein